MRSIPRLYRRLRQAFRQWWECRTERCDYYRHYLAYGPPDMPHRTYHLQGEVAAAHFSDCTRVSRTGECPRCSDFERRLRA